MSKPKELIKAEIVFGEPFATLLSLLVGDSQELGVTLEKYLDPDNSVITPAREAEAPKSETATAAAPKENVKNAVDAFDELFNDN